MSGVVKTKKVLLAVMAIAAAAYFGTGGTFATFSAETSNNGDSIASGTLTMDNQVGTGSLCLSANGLVNFNPNCDKVVNLTNVAPGVFTATETTSVTIRNTGTLDATNFYLAAPYVNATLNGTVSGSGTGTTSLPITALEGTVATNDTIRVTYGNTTQDFTATAPAAGGATSISVSYTAAPAFSFTNGGVVTDQSSNTGIGNTDCYDKTTSGSVNGPTGGQNLPFVVTTNNPFCTTVAMWVQETTGGPTGNQHYCWYGYSTGAGTAPGACTAPIAGVTLSSGAACNSTGLSVTALNGNILQGDTLSVTSGSTVCTFTASATSYVGTSGSIAVTCVTTCAATSLASGSAVSDTKAISDLNSQSGNTVNTISRFDTLYGAGGRIQLYPVTSNGNTNQTAGAVRLSKYSGSNYSRTFQIGFYFPAPNNTNQNTLQGLASTFGMTWHMEQ